MARTTHSSNSACTTGKYVHFPRINNDAETDSFSLFNHSFFSHFQFPCFKTLRKSKGELDKKLLDNKSPLLSRFSFPGMESNKTFVDARPYRWPHDGSFDPKTTALVVIDMQNDFCSSSGYIAYQGYSVDAARAIIPSIQTLLSFFRAHGFPIYFTREGHRPDLSTLSSRELLRSRNNPSGLGIGDKGPLGRLLVRGEQGWEIIPELTPLLSENIIDKPGRSAFQHTDLGLLLKLKGIKNLVLCGVTTDVCVHSTMREANDNGFDCILMEDATAASEESLHNAAVESVTAEGGIFGAITKVKDLLKAWECGDADNR